MVRADVLRGIMKDLMNDYEMLRSDSSLQDSVHRLFESGLVSRNDVERMFLRGNMILSHGTDIRDWPELSMTLAEANRKKRDTMPTMSHRGLGAVAPTPAPNPRAEIHVLDWGLGREAVTPPPAAQRKRTIRLSWSSSLRRPCQHPTRSTSIPSICRRRFA